MAKKKTDPYKDPTMALHKVWHKFTDELAKKYNKDVRFCVDTKRLKNGKLKYFYKNGKELDFTKLVGYDVMCEVRKYIKKNPQIKMVAVDDEHHSGSQLLLIPHERKDYFMGTTMMFIPQCTSTQNTFFLYPNAVDELIEELKEIQKKQNKDPFWKKVKAAQRKFDKKTPAEKKKEFKRLFPNHKGK